MEQTKNYRVNYTSPYMYERTEMEMAETYRKLQQMKREEEEKKKKDYWLVSNNDNEKKFDSYEEAYGYYWGTITGLKYESTEMLITITLKSYQWRETGIKQGDGFFREECKKYWDNNGWNWEDRDIKN